MLYDRRDFGLLRLAGAYQWLPLAPLRSLSPLKGLYHEAELLSMMGLLTFSRSGKYLMPSPKGWSMFKLSEQIAKLEDRWGKKLERLLDKHKGKWKLYLPIGLSAWYFYGMLINSIRLGTRATFNQGVARRDF